LSIMITNKSVLQFSFFVSTSTKRIHMLTTPVEGTSIRIFPHRIGEQAKDSMFTLLFDEKDGHLLALISLDELGPLRTSAPVAFASKYLAPQAASTLALLGSGLQARYHMQGFRHALPDLKQVRIYSPTAEHRQHFAQQINAEMGLEAVAVTTAQQAIASADVIAVTADSSQPVFSASDVRPGTLVTSIARHAIPSELYTHARLVVPPLVGPDHHPSGWDPFPFRLNGGRDSSMVAATVVDILRQQNIARQGAERHCYLRAKWKLCLGWSDDALALQLGT
jgi:Ornithine cyclodeaminase/mu-crystallin family